MLHYVYVYNVAREELWIYHQSKMRQSFFSIIIVLLSIVYSIQANQAKSGFWSSLFSKGKTSDSVIASSVEVTSPHHDESSLKAGIAKFYDQVSALAFIISCGL